VRDNVPVTKSIYVEITIGAPVNEIWEKSQDPELHERWDFRFSEIDYLPREDGEPQKFRYASRLGGLTVDGTGESVGERQRPDGTASSALKFWSDHPLAIIREGAGFWRYVPVEGGTRFYTGYDYKVRWGWFGRLGDRVLFRPWIGWATALSFDRLRLWLEEGQTPESSFVAWISFLAARCGLGLLWLYQGIVPKLLVADGEVELAAASGFGSPEIVVLVAGIAEVALGSIFLLVPRWRWPYLLTAIAMAPLAALIAITDPSRFGEPFNPFAVNVLALALAVVGYFTWSITPRASRCSRKPEGRDDVDL
jgi:hypothetical protein